MEVSVLALARRFATSPQPEQSITFIAQRQTGSFFHFASSLFPIAVSSTTRDPSDIG